MIEPTFWTDLDFDDVSQPEPLLLYVYLISNPATACTGCYKLSLRTAASETRLPQDKIQVALETLVDLCKVSYDPDSGWLWVHGYFQRQFKAVPHRHMARSVVHAIDALGNSDCPFKDDFMKRYDSLIQGFRMASERLTNGFRKPEGEGEEEGEGKDESLETDTWRTSFTVYQAEEQAAYDALRQDAGWQAGRQKYHPNLDILLSLEKTHVDFWNTEAGWEWKKKSRSAKALNWKSTFATSLSLKGNQVWKDRQGRNTGLPELAPGVGD